MRLLAAAPVSSVFALSAVALALAACTPAAEESVAAPPQEEIQSSTAPSMGGPAALPTDGGVTPAPEAASLSAPGAEVTSANRLGLSTETMGKISSIMPCHQAASRSDMRRAG